MRYEYDDAEAGIGEHGVERNRARQERAMDALKSRRFEEVEELLAGLVERHPEDLTSACIVAAARDGSGDGEGLRELERLIRDHRGPSPAWDARRVPGNHRPRGIVSSRLRLAWMSEARGRLEREDVAGAREAWQTATSDYSYAEEELFEAELMLREGQPDRAHARVARLALQGEDVVAFSDGAGVETWCARNSASSTDATALRGQFTAEGFARLIATVAERPVRTPAGSNELAAWNASPDSGLAMGHGGRRLHLEAEEPLMPRSEPFRTLAVRVERAGHPARVLAAVSNAQLIAAEACCDMDAYLAARAPDSQGRCAMYRYTVREMDLGKARWPSMAAWICDDDSSEVGPAPEPHLDTGRLAKRGWWIANALFGIGYGTDDDVEDVDSLESFERELPLLAEHAHLAAYWMIHHVVAGNDDDLARLLDGVAEAEHPWTRDLADWSRVYLAGRYEPLSNMSMKELNRLRVAFPARAIRGSRGKPVEPPPEPDPPPRSPLLTEFESWLAASDATQREKAALVEAEWIGRLASLGEEERNIARHRLSKAINSPKLQSERKRLLARLA